jgi:predicted lipoprotein with Yx(FWY)xxD motif
MVRTKGNILSIVFVLFFGLGMSAMSWAQGVPGPLKTAKSQKLGTYLVDSKGMTLYIYDKDKESGKSVCNGGCARSWPPFAPKAGAPAAKAPLNIITRDDGTKQYAYKGKPLYYYRKDTKSGDTTGQGRGKVWWVVKP